uniref:Uncharacterized protein n=1 Tax=Nelumbo nucifera TaxID=4432 RepID=A0A822XPA1_NELNU|nr:TPA_asm: hypothetical protein HUJ06_023335 [Nelumbo nucifera]
MEASQSVACQALVAETTIVECRDGEVGGAHVKGERKIAGGREIPLEFVRSFKRNTADETLRWSDGGAELAFQSFHAASLQRSNFKQKRIDKRARPNFGLVHFRSIL